MFGLLYGSYLGAIHEPYLTYCSWCSRIASHVSHCPTAGGIFQDRHTGFIACLGFVRSGSCVDGSISVQYRFNPRPLLMNEIPDFSMTRSIIHVYSKYAVSFETGPFAKPVAAVRCIPRLTFQIYALFQECCMPVHDSTDISLVRYPCQDRTARPVVVGV